MVMDLRMSRGVQEVILLSQDERGRRRPRTVYRRSKRRKKGTDPLGSVGKVVRKLVAAQETAARTYLRRHDESNREKRDGWLRDLSYNVYRANRRGVRKVRGVIGLPSVEVDD
jgi:hypothetical protein